LNPNAEQLWTAPRWALALLLACLSMLGPFAIDTYPNLRRIEGQGAQDHRLSEEVGTTVLFK